MKTLSIPCLIESSIVIDNGLLNVVLNTIKQAILLPFLWSTYDKCFFVFPEKLLLLLRLIILSSGKLFLL